VSRAWLLVLVCLFSCDEAPSREEVLRGVVSQRLVPDMQALSQAAGLLTDSLRQLRAGAELAPTQHRWREALLAWERVYVLRIGPIVDNSGLLRARFWPLREVALRERIAAQPALDVGQVELLGVDLRGMYALEWLLFVDSAELVADSQLGARTRAAALAFAANAQRYADDALARLAGGGALADNLTERSQETISKLVNQLVATVEGLASERLAIVLEMHAHGNVRASEVQGAPSGSSRELVLAQLRASQRLYRKLALLVVPVAPKIHERVQGRFERALRLVNEVDGPLEQVVLRDRNKLEVAFRALKELELALKVDLASALGVTLTFTAGDGD
jgi:uncharacterized protein